MILNLRGGQSAVCGRDISLVLREVLVHALWVLSACFKVWRGGVCHLWLASQAEGFRYKPRSVRVGCSDCGDPVTALRLVKFYMVIGECFV